MRKFLSLVVFCLMPFTVTAQSLPLDKIRLPAGFSISIFAADLPGARSLALADDGTVFVGTRRQGLVYALRDSDGDHKADKRYVIARDLFMPNGVAFHNGDLYVAEVNRVIRFRHIVKHLASPPKAEVINEDFPDDEHHGWKFIGFGPDGYLYVPIGVPCNVCDEAGYGVITRMRADGSDKQVVARGVRNSVGFDWHPLTKQLWFTDNGRDHLGDDLPPDELNRVSRQGEHFGFPWCHAGTIADPDYRRKHACRGFTAPALNMGAHVAPLGMRFYTGKQFPEKYRQQIFIAEHGSWNRSRKVGYQLSLVTLEANRVIAYQPFATGWLQGERAWGRPVDLLVMPDGSLLVSDDYAGVIYRVHYR